ncbi:cytochrome c oxidase assembly factor Coa1 family protein [Rubripirellula reticaptiva]|uniref:Cytochrome oxidase complex assembly protein 1 n=1 Tax=Rubripirellula reticaptiva TaxID=2528013 RepID=A0A5C6EHE9_9BACT|nr:cytochrome c oxidase assembly factor Coa1 family protein [Rubripirellula reticaptiva]TWU48432.1 hypothetical protein Poly59_52800 [Rubripirellula reticaptiva]
MSMNPNNQFDANPNAPGNSGSYGQAPPKKSKAKFWLLGCGITGLVGILVCCGGSILMTQFGLSVLAGEFQKQLEGNPVIAEHIGDIDSFSMNWSDTIQAAQSADSGAEELAFAISGSKGSGKVMIQQDKSGDGTGMQSAVLVMDDGERYPIELAANPADDLNMDDIFDEGELPVEIQ